MKLITLIERLDQLGAEKISKSTIKRWAFDEMMITMPVDKHGNKFKGGRQRATDWPEEALEEAAAVWAVRHNERGVQIAAEKARIIKNLALCVWTGWPIYRTAPVCNSPPEDIPPQFASEGITGSAGSDVISLFSGRDKKDKVRLLDDLVIKWIATVGKVRYASMQEESARQQGRSFHHERPLGKGAVVVLEFRRTPSEDERYQDGRLVTYIGYVWLRQIIFGAESDRDDKIILSENSIGTQVLFERDIDFQTHDSTPPTLDRIMESVRRQAPYDRTAERIIGRTQKKRQREVQHTKREV